jgi:hypothetical protein
MPLPIPARFEQREEYDRAQEWRKRFASELTPFLDAWVPRGIDTLKLIDLLTIPYVPRWTFGEDLAALLEPAGSSGTRTPGQAASYGCETLAALLVLGFAKVDLLVSSRDEYIHAARSASQERQTNRAGTVTIFISCSQGDAYKVVPSIAGYLKGVLGEGFRIDWDAENFLVGEDLYTKLRVEIEQADAYLVVVGPSFTSSKWQQSEIEQVMRQNLRSERAKPIIPIVIKGAEEIFASTRLADYHAVFFDPEKDPVSQLVPVVSRLTRMSSPSKQPGQDVYYA